MVITKIFLVAGAIALLLVMAQRQQWVQRAGLTGRCYPVNTSATDSTLYACEQGKLTGFRDLGSNGCTPVRITAHRALWRCPAPLEPLSGS